MVLHTTSARAALTAYCAAEDTALQDALAAIPFRSPYRDWVQILKALQHLPDEPEKAAGLLARIGDESAFHQLRRVAQRAVLPETSWPVIRSTASGSSRPGMPNAGKARGMNRRTGSIMPAT